MNTNEDHAVMGDARRGAQPKLIHDHGRTGAATAFSGPAQSSIRRQGTYETFNMSGKTDILLREGERNVFIAECKFWK